MRYPAFEKLEITASSSNRIYPRDARWTSSAFYRDRPIAGTIAINLAASKRWPTSRQATPVYKDRAGYIIGCI